MFLTLQAVHSQPCWDRPLHSGDNVLIQLTSGDELSGDIVAVSDSLLRIQTVIGIATVRCSEVEKIFKHTEIYRFPSHLLLLPTAEPIGNTLYLSLTGLVLLHAGIAPVSWLSIAAARSILPRVAASEQVSMLHVKLSSPQLQPFSSPEKLRLASGVVLGWLNERNPIHHLYIAGSIHRVRSQVTALLFYHFGGPELFTIRFADFFQSHVRYGRGVVGFALGIDTQLPVERKIHVLAELWNINLAKPTQTAVMLGIRFAHFSIAGDFGIAFFPQPLLLPLASFWWTPL